MNPCTPITSNRKNAEILLTCKLILYYHSSTELILNFLLIMLLVPSTKHATSNVTTKIYQTYDILYFRLRPLVPSFQRANPNPTNRRHHQTDWPN